MPIGRLRSVCCLCCLAGAELADCERRAAGADDTEVADGAVKEGDGQGELECEVESKEAADACLDDCEAAWG